MESESFVPIEEKEGKTFFYSATFPLKNGENASLVIGSEEPVKIGSDARDYHDRPIIREYEFPLKFVAGDYTVNFVAVINEVSVPAEERHGSVRISRYVGGEACEDKFVFSGFARRDKDMRGFASPGFELNMSHPESLFMDAPKSSDIRSQLGRILLDHYEEYAKMLVDKVSNKPK